MSYDEFAERLRKIQVEFLRVEGREITTVKELEQYLDKRLAKPKSRAARSLKGMF